MNEILGPIDFKYHFDKTAPLDEVIDALEITRPHAKKIMIDPGALISDLFYGEVIKPDDSKFIASAKALAIAEYYLDHRNDCDAVIERWNS